LHNTSKTVNEFPFVTRTIAGMDYRRLQSMRFVRIWYIFTVLYSRSAFARAASLADILSEADDLLVRGHTDDAIAVYLRGIQQEEAAKSRSDNGSSSLLTVVLSLYTNLGTALSSQDQNEKAVEYYESALQIYRQEINSVVESAKQQQQHQEAKEIAASAAFYLGMVQQDSGHALDAVEAYGLALELDEYHWAAAANRGSVQQDVLKEYRQALASYNEAYRILMGANSAPPTDPPEEPSFTLSQLQYRIGLCITYDATQKCIVQDTDNDEPTTTTPRTVDCRELATHAFALAVQYDPNNEFAKHMLASMTADATMTRASNEYVKALFDDYATHFEHSLVNDLHYTGFERLRRGFDRAIQMNGQQPEVSNQLFDTVMDAGCGTGLAGEQFRNVSKTLIGVDLSQAIFDQALLQRPGLYDEVIAGDVLQAFRKYRAGLSLIIAADRYIYFGNLDPLFKAMNQGLEEGGLAAFTLENVSVDDERILETTKSDWRWQLTASGRFAHRKEYVVKAVEDHGFTVLCYEPLVGKCKDVCLVKASHYETSLDFRFESGVGVRGHLFVLRKRTSLSEWGNDEL
jgi:predicted TPR repeat methyltransferase